MTTRLDDFLYQAAATTFESFAFICGDRARAAPSAEARLEASVRFAGPVVGRLVLRTPDPVLEAVTGNILGAIQPADPAYQMDALGELANIICGNALTALHQAGVAFQMECPQVMPVNRTVATGEALAAAAAIELDVGRAEVELFLVQGGPATP